MQYELEARTRQGMEERIENLTKLLLTMQSDFAKCAKTGISECFFCANDKICSGRPEDCNFSWAKHLD